MDAVVAEQLASWIFDENKVVTAKWLSSQLGLGVPESKGALARFFLGARQDEGRRTLSAVVCEIVPDPGTGFPIGRVRLRRVEGGGTLDAGSVLSVQAFVPKDSSVLYAVDTSLESLPPPVIRCPRLTKHQEEPTKAESPTPPQDETAVQTHTESKSDTSVKPATVSKGAKNTSTKKNNIANLFAHQQKNTSFQARSSTAAVNGTPKESDVQKAQAPSKQETKERSRNGRQQTKGKQKGENKRKPESAVSNQPKQRKRIKVFADDSSESELEQNEGDDEEDPLPPGHGRHPTSLLKSDSEDDDPGDSFPNRSDENQQKPEAEVKEASATSRQHRWVSKQFMDEDGYLVTRKVMEVVEEETAPGSETVPLASKDSSVKSKPPESKPGAKTGAKKAGNQKQSSLMSFFSRK